MRGFPYHKMCRMNLISRRREWKIELHVQMSGREWREHCVPAGLREIETVIKHLTSGEDPGGNIGIRNPIQKVMIGIPVPRLTSRAGSRLTSRLNSTLNHLHDHKTIQVGPTDICMCAAQVYYAIACNSRTSTVGWSEVRRRFHYLLRINLIFQQKSATFEDDSPSQGHV